MEEQEASNDNLIAGRKRRQIKQNKMDDHIYYNDDEEAVDLEEKFNALTEE